MKLRLENCLDSRKQKARSERTLIMGVLNVTPDSFSDGGMYLSPSQALERAQQMLEEGVDIIDIGGESTRPGSEPITVEEELGRVMPVIQLIQKSLDVPLSIDTYKSEVAREALSSGVSFVNDITALRHDKKMAKLIALFNAGVILMHMKGSPKTMQGKAYYGDVIQEIYSYLAGSIEIAESFGINPDKIIIDPGIGFGKTLEHNLTILRELKQFKKLGKPILVGTSRKSFIGTLTDKDASDRAFGTAASVAVSIMNGASIVRVHDIDEMRDVVRVVDALVKV